MKDKKEKYPEGHFVNKWMAIGMPLGLPLGLAFGGPEFLGIGLAMGMCVGLAIGSSVESKYKKEGKIRPLTKQEMKKKRIGIIAGVIALLIGAAVFLLLYFLR